MENAPPPVSYRYRFISLTLFIALLLIEILVLALMEMNFNLRKKELHIVHKKPLDEIQTSVRTLDYRLTLDERIDRAFEDVVTTVRKPSFPAISVEIVSATGESIKTWEPEDIRAAKHQFNTWGNSLFTRGFEFSGVGTISGAPGYELRVTFVSWPDFPEVQELVNRYRTYAVLFTLAHMLVGFLIYSGAIRPLARIARALADRMTELPPLISHPIHEVERAYNRLARETRLTRVHFGLTDLADGVLEQGIEAGEASEQFWNAALGTIREGMQYQLVGWCAVGSGGEMASPHWNGLSENNRMVLPQLSAPSGNSAIAEVEWLEIDGTGQAVANPAQNGPTSAWLLGAVQRRGDLAGWLVACPDPSEESKDSTLLYFRALTRQVGLILTRALERREALDRGRYEVSIDLSTSMGHDLTNILATGKLELETLRSAFKRGIVQVPEAKSAAVLAALEGLRKTTILLQEVVNVYRAFSFTRAPHFEQVNLNELADEVINLYRHSTSRPVTYHLAESEVPIFAYAEPRLLKLVLFNLLANATQAITERQSYQPDPPGTVEIECFERDGWSVLRVIDNGTGFQNRKGERLLGIELQQIFQFDFTTKRRQGGLGLAWVRSIIADIHQGQLAPMNRDDGVGAVMEALLPQVAPVPGGDASA